MGCFRSGVSFMAPLCLTTRPPARGCAHQPDDVGDQKPIAAPDSALLAPSNPERGSERSRAVELSNHRPNNIALHNLVD